jgi:hypothetical protein
MVAHIEGGTRLRVFENRVPRRIFGPKRDEVTGEWRKIHLEELTNIYSSPDIIRVIKPDKNEMSWACSIYGERRGVTRFCCGNLRERDHLGDPGLDGKIILKWIFRKWMWWAWAGLIWLRIGTGDGHLCMW